MKNNIPLDIKDKLKYLEKKGLLSESFLYSSDIKCSVLVLPLSVLEDDVSCFIRDIPLLPILINNRK